MARNFFRFSLKIIPHGGPEKKYIYSRRELVTKRVVNGLLMIVGASTREVGVVYVGITNRIDFEIMTSNEYVNY